MRAAHRAARPAAAPIATLLYRSRATVPLDDTDLGALAGSAQRHNRLLGVTGSLFYRAGRFIQWLEGPPNAVAQLFTRISCDPRHTDVELISYGSAGGRLFSDWNMRLFHERKGVPPVSAFYEQFSPLASRPGALRDAALGLCHGDSAALEQALDEADGNIGAQVCVCEHVIGAYADIWAEDLCDEIAISLGLQLALSTFRRRQAAPELLDYPLHGGPLLVATVPGECHSIGVALASTMLGRAGRETACAWPASDAELADMLDERPYQGLALVCSGVFSRRHWARRIRQTCQLARHHSARPFQVVLYGRFGDDSDRAIADTGADGTCQSALQLPEWFGRLARLH